MSVREMTIPPDAFTAEEACEILRAWIIDKGLQVSVLPGAFPKPLGWGILLADVAYHIADALAESKGADRTTVLEDIARAFNVEMKKASAEHTGSYVEPPGG